MEQLKMFATMLKGSIKDLLPIIVVIAFFQTVILQSLPDNLISIIIGVLIVAVGLSIFIQGLEIGIFPVGENLANEFAKKGSLFWLMLFAFLLGFSTSVAEPALIAVAGKAELVSSGRLDATTLRIVVALSVGCAIVLSVFRILTGHPIQYYIIAGYTITIVLTGFAPKEIIGLAYDSGGVATSTVTVPLIAALGVGLASSIRGRDPVVDGFGVIAFASLAPIIFVLSYGMIVYNFGEAKEVMEAVSSSDQSRHYLVKLVFDLFNVIRDVLPILFVIGFFQFIIIKKTIPKLKQSLIGIVFVIFGLYAFIVGLEMGLFPIGEAMAKQLTANGNVYLIYLFGFLVGFSTTMAEPALLAVAQKVENISKGAIKQIFLRISVAIGVAIGISLGCYRIVQGDPIADYIIVGYIFVVILTFLSPKFIIPIAYDSGAITTSTVTVPLVAALGLGLATNIEGRSVLVDGFGLIAFASLFPMLTVMSSGIVSRYLFRKNVSKK